MQDIFSVDGGKIIKDIKYLKEDFVPESLKHRNGQIREIARSIGQFIDHDAPFNLFLYGPPGTGKTTTVKFLFNELRRQREKAIGIYINVWKNSTGFAILQDMAEQINENLSKLLNFKRSLAEAYGLIERYLKKERIKIILALDEIDKIEDDDILYVFSRDNIPLIMISNNEFALQNLDERVRSSMIYEGIEFKPYSFDEIYDILNERHKKAFYPDAFPKEFIRVCASASKGDARVGIGMMRVAALIAEKKGKDKVDIEDIRESYKEAKKLKDLQILSTLTKYHKILYDIVTSHREISSKELHEIFTQKVKNANLKSISERSVRNYLQDLVTKGLIISEGDTRWRIYKAKDI